MAAPKKYPEELRERAVRLYRESDPKPVIRRLAEQVQHQHQLHHGDDGEDPPPATVVAPRPPAVGRPMDGVENHVRSSAIVGSEAQ